MYWKKWAAKHEYEELKEGAWLEPGFALLRKKVRENWTEKHRNVASKVFLEGGWTQKKKAVRCWMVGYQSVSSLPDGGRHRKARPLPLSGMARGEARRSRSFQEVGAKGENVKEGVEVAKRCCCTPLSESRWNSGHSIKMWESE